METPTASTTYASLSLTEDDHLAYENALRYVWSSLGAHIGVELPGCPTRYHHSPQRDHNPARTNQLIAQFTSATVEDVDEAVRITREMARSRTLEKMGWEGRLELVASMGQLIQDKRFDIAAILTYETGKTRAEALAEVNEVNAMIAAYTTFARECNNYSYLLNDGSQPPYEHSLSLARPLGGPVAVIVPFNFPFALAANMSLAAFLAGNPLIIKPASDTPLTTWCWYDVMRKAGVPPEACIFLAGPGSSVGEALIRHPGISCIAFTGSLETGKRITAAHNELFQQNIFRANPVMEMGGKNPVIVTRHANLEAAAEGIIRATVGFGGQKCSATSRIYAEKGIIKELQDRILKMARVGFPNGQKIMVGFPEIRETYVGPVINRAAFGRYHSVVTQMRYGGADVFPLHDHVVLKILPLIKPHGYFVQPLLAVGLPHEHPLNREEHFIPVATLMPIDSLEEGIAKANDTVYALCAGFFSEDEDEQRKFLAEIEAGVVYTNRRDGATTGSWPTMQNFGGWKGSGTSGKNSFGKWYALNFTREQDQTRVLG